MADDIKVDFEEQNQEPEDFMTTSDKIASKIPEEYHNLEELEDMGADRINQKIGRIEDINLTSNKLNHAIDLAIVPKAPNELSEENNHIIQLVLKEDQVIEVPHIDSIFKD